MKVLLQPINSRFKRLIHDFGSIWVEVSEPRPMFCFGGELGVTCSPEGNSKKVSNFKVGDIRYVS